MCLSNIIGECQEKTSMIFDLLMSVDDNQGYILYLIY